jgi:hypothetical protein
VSQSAHDQLQAENEQLKAQLAQQQAQQKWVVTSDVLFLEGGYQLGASGQLALSQYAEDAETCRTPRSSSTAIPPTSP